MNQINPKKLLNSKWTAVKPKNKEKHFIVTEVEFDEYGRVLASCMEAVLTKRSFAMEWKDLKDKSVWLPGWK